MNNLDYNNQWLTIINSYENDGKQILDFFLQKIVNNEQLEVNLMLLNIYLNNSDLNFLEEKEIINSFQIFIEFFKNEMKKIVIDLIKIIYYESIKKNYEVQSQIKEYLFTRLNECDVLEGKNILCILKKILLKIEETNLNLDQNYYTNIYTICINNWNDNNNSIYEISLKILYRTSNIFISCFENFDYNNFLKIVFDLSKINDEKIFYNLIKFSVSFYDKLYYCLKNENEIFENLIENALFFEDNKFCFMIWKLLIKICKWDNIHNNNYFFSNKNELFIINIVKKYLEDNLLFYKLQILLKHFFKNINNNIERIIFYFSEFENNDKLLILFLSLNIKFLDKNNIWELMNKYENRIINNIENYKEEILILFNQILIYDDSFFDNFDGNILNLSQNLCRFLKIDIFYEFCENLSLSNNDINSNKNNIKILLFDKLKIIWNDRNFYIDIDFRNEYFKFVDYCIDFYDNIDYLKNIFEQIFNLFKEHNSLDNYLELKNFNYKFLITLIILIIEDVKYKNNNEFLEICEYFIDLIYKYSNHISSDDILLISCIIKNDNFYPGEIFFLLFRELKNILNINELENDIYKSLILLYDIMLNNRNLIKINDIYKYIEDILNYLINNEIIQNDKNDIYIILNSNLSKIFCSNLNSYNNLNNFLKILTNLIQIELLQISKFKFYNNINKNWKINLSLIGNFLNLFLNSLESLNSYNNNDDNFKFTLENLNNFIEIFECGINLILLKFNNIKFKNWKLIFNIIDFIYGFNFINVKNNKFFYNLIDHFSRNKINADEYRNRINQILNN